MFSNSRRVLYNLESNKQLRDFIDGPVKSAVVPLRNKSVMSLLRLGRLDFSETHYPNFELTTDQLHCLNSVRKKASRIYWKLIESFINVGLFDIGLVAILSSCRSKLSKQL